MISGNGTNAGGTSGSPYDDNGIQIDHAVRILIQGNFIGTDATGASPISNSGNGVFIDYSGSDNTIGGTGPSAQNVIAYNDLAGVDIQILGQSGGGGALCWDRQHHPAQFHLLQRDPGD